jgi:succinyldiaminopimelate transaminase
MNPVLERLGGYPLAAFQDLRRELAADGRPLHDFSIGDPVEETPAFVREALVAGLPAVSQYPTASGLGELRSAIAAWIARRFGVRVDPDAEVLPTAGSKEAIFHLPLALVDPAGAKRSALWGDPGYMVYERGMLFAGGESDPVALRDPGWRLELASLGRDRLDRACIAWLNYPHNPTGATVDLAFYRRAIETARSHGIVLASDECYCDLYPEGGERPPSLLHAAGDPGDPDLTGMLVAFSLSKRSGMTGYRCGALVGDPDLIAQQRVLRPNIGTASPEFVQRAAIAAWSDDAHVAERRVTFDAKRRILLALFEDLGMPVSGSTATIYVWVRAPGGDDAAYAEALLRRRVIVSPGRAFGPSGAGWLRLALVPDVGACQRAADLWREAAGNGELPGHDR